MSSTKLSFIKEELCPVVGHMVTLNGICVSLPGGPSSVARQTCSTIEKCLSVHESIDRIPNCLLHNLQE